MKQFFGKYRILRLFFLALLIVFAGLALSALPECCEGLRVVHPAPVFFWTSFLLLLFGAFQYCRKRDNSLSADGMSKYEAACFSVPRKACKRCGTNTFLIFRWPEEDPIEKRIVLPGMPLKTGTVEYCPHCRKTRLGEELRAGKNLSPMRIYGNRVKFFRDKKDRAWRIAVGNTKIQAAILAVSLLASAISGFVLRLHLLALPFWLLSIYLLFISSFHTLDRLLLRYWITDKGILRRNLSGYTILCWDDIHLIADIPDRAGRSCMLAVFSHHGNWLLASTLENYEAMRKLLFDFCVKKKTPVLCSTGK